VSQNEFTKANKNTGIPGQALLDAGLNVFGLDLFLESLTAAKGKDTTPLEITYKGVKMKFQIDDKAL
jgi:hypothetical protein